MITWPDGSRNDPESRRPPEVFSATGVLFVVGGGGITLSRRFAGGFFPRPPALEYAAPSCPQEHRQPRESAEDGLQDQAAGSWVQIGGNRFEFHTLLAFRRRAVEFTVDRERHDQNMSLQSVIRSGSRSSRHPVPCNPMAIRHDQGIVLRSYPFGESDRVVIILSPNHGKLRTVAKGVRKTKSRFGGRLEPLTHVDLVLYEGRNLDTVTQVSVIEAFPHVRTDLERVGIAGAMLNAVDAVAQENESAHRLFLLLHRGLRVLDSGPADPGLLTGFYLKLAALVGIAPSLGGCASCGGDIDVERFSFPAGGVVCSRCATADAVKLRPGLIDYLASLAGSELASLPASGGMAADGQGLARRFLEYHLERKFTVAEVPGG